MAVGSEVGRDIAGKEKLRMDWNQLATEGCPRHWMCDGVSRKGGFRKNKMK